MLKELAKKFIVDDKDDGRLAIEYMINLPDDDYKRVAEAIKMYRKGESLREDYYDKADAILQSQESVDYITAPAEVGGRDD